MPLQHSVVRWYLRDSDDHGARLVEQAAKLSGGFPMLHFPWLGENQPRDLRRKTGARRDRKNQGRVVERMPLFAARNSEFVEGYGEGANAILTALVGRLSHANHCVLPPSAFPFELIKSDKCKTENCRIRI